MQHSQGRLESARLRRIARASSIVAPVVLGLLPLAEPVREGLGLWGLCAYASVVSLLVLVLAARATRQRFWSVSSVYLAVFALFHFGVVYSYAIATDDALTSFNVAEWFYADEVPLAIAAALAGMVAFHGASRLMARRGPAPPPADADELPTVAGPAGFVLILGAIAWWLTLTIRAGGVALLFAAYHDFLAATAELDIGVSYFVIGVGLSLLVASPQRNWLRAGFLLFGLWAMIALPLGLRGEVLFPCAGAAALAAKRRPLMSTPKALALVAVSLVLIDLIRQLRQFGIAGAESSLLDLQPTDALLELGSSLLPTVTVIQWLDTGDAFMNGATYWAPFDRALYYLVPGATRVAAEDDLRIMNVLVLERVGPIGFSPVAEAFYNFGRIGVVVVMALTGMLLGWIDRWDARPIRVATAGAFLFPSLLQIRNTFVSTPSWIAIGLAIVGSIVLLERLRRRGRARGSSSRADGIAVGGDSR